jgi:hypothetical protein
LDAGTIDPFAGVVKPDELKVELKRLARGAHDARSYIRGALQWLERKPPNPYIVPLLKRAMERYPCQ